jgi:hypothetical protein
VRCLTPAVYTRVRRHPKEGTEVGLADLRMITACDLMQQAQLVSDFIESGTALSRRLLEYNYSNFTNSWLATAKTYWILNV